MITKSNLEKRCKVGNKDKGCVVKIDSSLLSRVEKFIKEEENRLRFTNKKQLIDIAVDEFLKKMVKK